MSIQSRKRKVIIHTDSPLTKSGFGKNCKLLMDYLYRTGKYELVNFAMGIAQGNSDLDRMPYKCIGTVNGNQLMQLKSMNQPQSHSDLERLSSYGQFSLNDIMKQEKPDCYIGIQDPWGLAYAVDLKWYNKIPSVIWTTLDSLPILPQAADIAKKSKEYWSWADFATKAMHKMGKEYEHVKTVRGIVDTKNYFRLPDSKKIQLRNQFKIDKDTFIIGFVFRNQLRKSVPNLLEGYSLFKKDNPKLKTKLLFHTHFAEGWDIHKLATEFNVDKNDILTTYICRNCSRYEIKSYTNQEIKCPYCFADKGQVTTNPQYGVSEEILNEVYNLMNVYVHPFTSGGQELPIQEAKLTELVTLVTNYSCGEDSCNPEAGSLPLEYAEYREPGTQFIKATTYPSSICKQLNKFLSMKDVDKKELGIKGRKWVLDNFSVEKVGKFIEDFIDLSPLITDDSVFLETMAPKDPNAQIPNIPDDEQWICELYKQILKVEPDRGGGVEHWKNQLKSGMTRRQVEDCFRNIAMGDNQKIGKPFNFEDLLEKNDKKRVILIQPESSGDCFLITSLFKSIRDRYPKETWDFYISSKKEYKDIFDGNEYVTKWIEYLPQMDQHIWLVGNAQHNGFFNVAYHPYFGTQKMLNYLNDGSSDKLDLDIISK